jgi:hypothetical protein
MRIRLVLIVGLILVGGLPLARAQEGTPSLPADLILTSGVNFHADNQLLWVNAQTLEGTMFYDDETASQIVALKWSPQGDLLIIHRTWWAEDTGDIHDLCTLTRDGRLLSCFVETPARYYPFPGVYASEKTYPISWSADGQRVYFPAGRKTGDYTGSYALVEADPISGQTIRTLYEYFYDRENGYDPAYLNWNDTLDTMLVGWGWPVPEPVNKLPMLVNPLTGEILVDALATRAIQYTTSVEPEQAQAGLDVSGCPTLPPQANYLTLTVYSYAANFDNLNGLLIMNRQGEVSALIGKSGDHVHVMDCPTWQADEQALFFIGVDTTTWGSGLYKYSLPDQQLTILYSPGGDLLGPLNLSPDGSCLLFYTWASHDSPGIQWVRAWCSGSLLTPGGNHGFTAFPVWVPPLTGTPRTAPQIGGQAVVQVFDDTLNVRSCAGVDCDTLEKLDNGTRVTVLEGPQVAENYNGWRIRTPSGTEGWAVGGADGIQTLTAP